MGDGVFPPGEFAHDFDFDRRAKIAGGLGPAVGVEWWKEIYRR